MRSSLPRVLIALSKLHCKTIERSVEAVCERYDMRVSVRAACLLELVGDLSEAGSSAGLVFVAAGSAANSDRANRVTANFDWQPAPATKPTRKYSAGWHTGLRLSHLRGMPDLGHPLVRL